MTSSAAAVAVAPFGTWSALADFDRLRSLTSDFDAETADFGSHFGLKPQTSVPLRMEALLDYASDATASDAPGDDDAESVEPQEEQVSGATDVEFTAEERLLDVDGSEGGMVAFLACCPPFTKDTGFIVSLSQQQSSRTPVGRMAAFTISSPAIPMSVWAIAMKTASGPSTRTPSAGSSQLSPTARTQSFHTEI